MPTPDADRFALIIGAMKSGTTTLFEYLSRHPEVAPSSPKEPNFFSVDTTTPPDLDAYRAHWRWEPGRHAVALEASTSYTMLPATRGVPARMAAMANRALEGIEFKFIYVMRDPIDRIASHLSHIATRRGGEGRIDEGDVGHAVEVSKYATQLDPYLDIWPREAIFPLVYEHMIEEPSRILARVHEFLGLSPEPVEGPSVHNTRIDLAADQLLVDLLDRAPWLRVLRKGIPGPALGPIRRLIGRRGAKDMELTETQVERVIETIRPEVERLRSEWGVDTTPWRSFS